MAVSSSTCNPANRESGLVTCIDTLSADGHVIGYEDDPATFEAELRRREGVLGSAHPAVAESASNLAILYNQVSA